VQDGEVWLTQDGIAQLFDVDRSVVTKHLKNFFQDGELAEKETRAKFTQVADNGKTYQYHSGQKLSECGMPTVNWTALFGLVNAVGIFFYPDVV